MITVNIKVTDYLKRLKGCSEGKVQLKVPLDSNVRYILQYLGALPGDVGLVILNGKIVNPDNLINDGDSLELYQIFGGG